MKVKTWEISGMGEGYEDVCQAMLWDALEWLADKPKDIFLGTDDSSNDTGPIRVIGVTPLPPKLKELEDMLDKRYQPSGMVHQAVFGHAKYIHEHSIAEWHVTMQEARPDEKPREIDLEKTKQVVAKYHKLTPEQAFKLGLAAGKKAREQKK